MILNVENKKPVHPQSFARIETALKALKSYGPSSFASLSDDSGAYVQVAGGPVSALLERRLSFDPHVMRAFLSEKRSPFEGIQTLVCGAGRILRAPDEILFLEDVLPVFRAFYEGSVMPSEVKWRKIPDYAEG